MGSLDDIKSAIWNKEREIEALRDKLSGLLTELRSLQYKMKKAAFECSDEEYLNVILPKDEDAWQLYSSLPQEKLNEAVRGLNAVLRKELLRFSQAVAEYGGSHRAEVDFFGAMDKIQTYYSDCGASDSEPDVVVQRCLLKWARKHSIKISYDDSRD